MRRIPGAAVPLASFRLVAQRGFSLIEVLVTLLVISLALLGTAGLQAYAMRQNQNGQFRTQAVFLVADLSERIEANKAGAVGNKYKVPTAGSTPVSTPRSVTDDCTEAICSADQLAEFDLWQWETAVSQTLPQSTWTITSTGANPVTYTVTVTWVDRRTDSDNVDIGTGGRFSYTATRAVSL